MRRRSRPRLIAVVLIVLFLFLTLRSGFFTKKAETPGPKSPPPTNLEPHYDQSFSRTCASHGHESEARANATFLILCRDSELDGVLETLRGVEELFNDRFHYPFTLLNEVPFSEHFKKTVREAVPKSEVTFDVVPPEMWGFPEWIDQDKARRKMKKMKESGVKYADVEGYHHMCRFYSGFFYKHPALAQYKWYWRLEPNVEFFCKLTYDPFLYMQRNNKKYAFTSTIWEVSSTVPSLFYTLSQHYDINPSKHPMISAFIERKVPSLIGKLLYYSGRESSRGFANNGYKWNMCHFWSNFEIADLDWFRTPEYEELFNVVDRAGGIYYERWGDAPIHSLAIGLLLDPSQVHYIGDNIGYRHDDLATCPKDKLNTGCECNNCKTRTNKHVRIPQEICLNYFKRTVQWTSEIGENPVGGWRGGPAAGGAIGSGSGSASGDL